VIYKTPTSVKVNRFKAVTLPSVNIIGSQLNSKAKLLSQSALKTPQHKRSLNSDTGKIKNTQTSLLGKITEIITSDEQESSLTMLLPLLATLSKDDRWFAWVSPPKNLPKSLLEEAGIALDKIMLLYPDDQNSALKLAKKALSAGTCHAVISWSGSLSEHELVNLEQSAQRGASHGILIRRRQK
jgi:cell division inhibitor SulA